MDSTLHITPGLTTGEKLLHFQVREQIASGGQGIVWKGYDSLLDRFVAIKQIASPEGIEEGFRARFRAQAQIQKRVSSGHPNIVNVIDLVDDHRGLFIVMEFVDGVSLDRLLAQTGAPIEPIRALKIVRDVALALAAIHAAGVIHRDLKPGNILLPSDGGPAKVCDFGLAAIMVEQDTMTLGTAAYMAPELFGGEAADGRCDIYALGMIAYEMLAGRPAFEQAFKAVLRDQRNQAMRWMKWHTNVRVTAPPLTELNPKLPSKLTELIERMMAKDPGQRIASAAQLVEAINRHFGKGAAKTGGAGGGEGGPARAGAPGVAPSPMTAVATAALPQRKRWPLIVAGIVVFWTLVAGGVMLYRDRQAQAVLAEQHAAGQADFQAAQQAYGSEDYAKAEQLYGALADRFPDHPLYGITARVGQQVSRAHQDTAAAAQLMADNRFDDSIALYDKTTALLDKSLAESKNGAIDVADAIIELQRKVDDAVAFAKIARDLNVAIESDNLDEATRVFYKLREIATRGKGGLNALTDEESAKVSELFGRLEARKQREAVTLVLAKSRDLIDAGKLLEARDYIEAERERYASNDELRELGAQVVAKINYEAAISQARQAVNAGRHDEAITALQRANDIFPSDDLRTQIRDQRVAKLWKEAEEALAAKNNPLAVTKLNEILTLDPSQERAEKILESIASGAQYDQILAQARSDLEGKRYEQAINGFERALKMQPDPAVEAERSRAYVGMHLSRAQALIDRDELEAARGELNNVLKYDPQNPKVPQALRHIDFHLSLRSQIAAADKLREKAEYAAAKKMYRDLLKLAEANGVKLPDVERKLKDAEMDHMVQQVRGAIEVKNPKLARSMYEAARSYRPADDRLPPLEVEVKALESQFK